MFGLDSSLILACRHRGLCDYINHATTAVHRAILSVTVKRILVVIFLQDLPREQFVFDIMKLSQKRLDTAGRQIELEETFLLMDAEQQLRAVLSKLRNHCVPLEALDEQGTFGTIMDADKDSALELHRGRRHIPQVSHRCLMGQPSLRHRTHMALCPPFKWIW